LNNAWFVVLLEFVEAIAWGFLFGFFWRKK